MLSIDRRKRAKSFAPLKVEPLRVLEHGVDIHRESQMDLRLRMGGAE
jgi:hypothetical protein